MTTVTDRLNGISTSVAVKPPCKAVAIASVALSGLQTVNGIAVAAGDRVLVTAQASSIDNGIYVASTSAWQRATDFDGNRDVVNGTLVIVNRTVGRDALYQVTATNPIVIGASAIDFILINDPNVSHPITDAEISAGFDESGISESFTPIPIDVQRYGIVPNSAAARTANTTALQALLDPTTTGPIGKLIFPPVIGSDTYYFDDLIDVRDHIHMDLMGCTLDFAKDYEESDDRRGFLNFIRDVSVENGAINIVYDGSEGQNAGQIMKLGSRNNYPFGSFTSGIDDEDLAVPMGNIVLRNLRISTTNTLNTGILMLAGLQGVTLENIHIDGNDALQYGIYYEFGFYHFDETAADATSSHASGLVFRNIFITNLDDSAGAGLSLIGVNDALVENLHVDTAQSALVVRPGEALYYNRGAPYDGVAPHVTMRNITAKNIAGSSMSLTGAEQDSGYLSGEGLSESDQVDLISFSLDGFSLDAAILCSGALDARNGTIRNGGASGSLILTDECMTFNIENVSVLDGAASGIRASLTGIWGTPRLKRGTIRNCKIAGNTGNGILLGNCQGVTVENCQIGYNTTYDAGSETTQTGINVASTGRGVVARGNYVSVSSGNAYVLAGTGDRGCELWNMQGTATHSGTWKVDGIPVVSATNIADDSHAINTADKHVGKLIWDTSNSRLMYALGTGATDGWRVVDGSATVTPS